jgi:hypothetical protein
MAALAVVAKVGSCTGLVWSSPLHPRRHKGDEGGGQVKAELAKRAIAMATRVASDDDGNDDGGKSDGNGNEGAGQAATRAMAGNDEGNCEGDEGGEQRRG